MTDHSLFGRLRRMRILPPRDEEVYSHFERISDTVAEAAFLLTELFNPERRNGQELAYQIENCLTRCSQLNESVEDTLARAQQPPFSRSDISQFANDCVHIAKFINHAANRYVIYEIPSSDKEMRELGAIIREACEHIVQAVKSLRRERRIDAFSRAVDQLETRADEIYHGGLHRRFQEIRSDRSNLESRIQKTPATAEPQAILDLISANVEYTRHVDVFFILRQVYAELERAIDSCTDATDTLKRMVADNV